MRSPLRIALLLLSVALVAVACSATTAVIRDERLAADAATTATPGTAPAGGEADDTADQNSAAADDGADVGTDEDGEPSSARDLETAAGLGLDSAEQLGTLSNDCIAGNDMACDILFQVSGFDSDEETTALTCGGRSEDPVAFCTPDMDIDADATGLVFDETSSGLPAIVTACRDAGDMTACDFLYYRSPLESDTEAIGATCGDRVEVAVPDCRTFLAEG